MTSPHFFLSWDKGSPAELYYEVAKSLADRGHEVTIFTTDVFNKPRIGDASVRNLHGIRVYETRSLGHYPYCVSPGAIGLAANRIKEYDIVHIHEYRAFQSLVAASSACISKTPYIVQAHGALMTRSGASRLTLAFDFVLGGRMLRGASRVIAITQKEAELYRLMGVPSSRIEIIPNGVDLRDFEKLPKRGCFRRAYGIPDDDRLVLFVGRLDETKGIDMLIRSFAKIRAEIGNSKLAVVGKDYGSATKLNRIVADLGVQDSVIFTGFVDKEMKKAAYFDSDVFITPSFNGFPHTFLESCACGTPIVTTTKGDHLDWIDDNVGFVTEYNEDSIANATIRLLLNEHLRQSFGSQCLKLVKERFQWSAIAASLEKVYDAAIAESKEIRRPMCNTEGIS